MAHVQLCVCKLYGHLREYEACRHHRHYYKEEEEDEDERKKKDEKVVEDII